MATMIFMSIFLSGCIEKTLYPAVILTVVSVTPNELRITSTETTGTSITFPSTVIVLKSETQVPATLVSYSVSYSTNLGQSLPALRIEETPYDLFLAGGGSADITISPYTQKVADLFELSTSDISPIKATITLTVKDVNGNTVNREAHCLLYKS